MKRIYQGKTKDVYEKEDGTIRLIFKDEMTGKDGVFDPGENQVGLTVEGSGRSGLAVSQFFFERLNQEGIATHYLGADLEKKSMDVKKAVMFGRGLEVICRYKAVGSFVRRYGAYIEPGADLDGYVEITLKDDQRQDPLVTEDGLLALGILSEGEYAIIKKQTKRICAFVQHELAQKGLTLYDIKLEFGRGEQAGEIILIDELSGGNMRVFKGEEPVHPLELEPLLFA
ncbi:phosphoribosylaminoimidazolesuccinocarboxamide synthase [Enterococcus sp. LJL98]